MKKYLLLVILFVVLTNCGSKGENNKLEEFNFGVGKFDEPFLYLPSKPSFLVKSLEYTPGWFLTDTIYLSRTLELSFNEESVRSKSAITLKLGDSLGKPIPGIQVFFNNVLAKDNQIKLSTLSGENQDLELSLKLLPEFGAQSYSGGVFVVSDEVDEVNGQERIADITKFAEWKAEQKTGGTWLLWLIWLIIALLLLMFLSMVLKVLIQSMGSLQFLKTGNASSRIRKTNNRKLDPNRSYRRKEINKVFDKIKKKLHEESKRRGGGKASFIDCYTNRILKGGDRYDYEHIRSAEELFMQYRGVLTNEQIAEVVNCTENVGVTLRAINQSKGKRTFEDWCTESIVLKYGIDKLHAMRCVRNADLGIIRKVQEIINNKN